MTNEECAKRAHDLFAIAVPHLRRKDSAGLAAALGDAWSTERLLALLNSDDPEVVKLATVCLSVVADSAATPMLASVLHHCDPVAVYLAEHALWATWFRAGSADANRALRRAVQETSSQHFDPAIQLLTEHIQREPDFAELYNQRAIAHFLRQDFQRALDDCRAAVDHNAYHFGALAGMGHCYTQLGDLPRARDAYYAGLRIHPRMAGIRQTLRYVRQALEHQPIKSKLA